MLRKLLAIRVSHRYKSCEEFLLDWEDFDRRRQERNARRTIKPEAPPPPQKKSRVWQYAALGAALIVIELIVFYFTGMFE